MHVGTAFYNSSVNKITIKKKKNKPTLNRLICPQSDLKCIPPRAAAIILFMNNLKIILSISRLFIWATKHQKTEKEKCCHTFQNDVIMFHCLMST